jgi:membrane protease YdiL (CAAX protease family)
MIPRFCIAFWNRHFGEPLRAIEADSLAFRNSAAARRPDWKTVAVFTTVAVCLTIQNFANHPSRVADAAGFVTSLVDGSDRSDAVHRRFALWGGSHASSLVWWALCAVITYALIPIFVVKVVLRERLRNYGLKVRGMQAAWPVYAAFVAVMIPIVAVGSMSDRFQAAYPFYRVRKSEDLDWNFVIWELLYALQFVALEFFFRGFLIHGIKHRFGVYSAFAMMVPYCMIHFGKPLPEAAASMVAGIALGFVSLATRSIWLGAVLHISVAWSMDFATLARRGLLPFE